VKVADPLRPPERTAMSACGHLPAPFGILNEDEDAARAFACVRWVLHATTLLCAEGQIHGEPSTAGSMMGINIRNRAGSTNKQHRSILQTGRTAT
jgi:hypothetical protein